MTTPDEECRKAFELFCYNPKTGILTWRHNGKLAGGNFRGYIRTRINGKAKYVHRIAWLLYYGAWPTQHLDHINTVRSDNRISNLREAFKTENNLNRPKLRANTSGYKGVSRNGSIWKARANLNGVQYHFGSFPTAESAYEVYKREAKKLHGEFFHG